MLELRPKALAHGLHFHRAIHILMVCVVFRNSQAGVRQVFNMVAEVPPSGPATWPPFPAIPQDSLLEYSSRMALYATICGTMWRHESSPTKLSCGRVAGTLRERGSGARCIVLRIRVPGFRVQALTASKARRQQIQNYGCSVAGK